jgi:hypothetical protein
LALHKQAKATDKALEERHVTILSPTDSPKGGNKGIVEQKEGCAESNQLSMT